MSATYVIGDVHGQYEKLIGLLQDSNLVDNNLGWHGDDVTLCFMGDFCDRGPDGIGCVDLVMRLQEEATVAGGKIIALLGNHEPLLLAAYHFGNGDSGLLTETFWKAWKRNGGLEHDMERLTPKHIDWFSMLPAMTHLKDRLFVHADAFFYTEYGHSVDEVNRTIGELLQGKNTIKWSKLLYQFSDRVAFLDGVPGGVAQAEEFLRIYGGKQIIHGHTPISYITRQKPAKIDTPLLYAKGLCLNVDGGMYQGGPGFVYEVED